MRCAPIVVVAAAVAAGACGKHDDGAAAVAEAHRLPILSDAVTARLGTIGLALAVDVNGLDALSFLGAHSPPCMRFLVAGMRGAVATLGDGGWQAIIDGAPEVAVRSCLAQLGVTPRLGSAGDMELDAGALTVAVHWHGDLATIRAAGAPERSGDAPQALFDVTPKIPTDAKAWIAATGFPGYKIAQAVGWLQIRGQTWTLAVTATGAAPGAAKAWLDSIVRELTVQLAGRGVTVDGSWFSIDESPPDATLTATIPTDQLK